MSRARGEGLRLLGGMLTGEPVAGREGGTSSLSLSLRPALSRLNVEISTKSSPSGTNVCRAGTQRA